MIIWLKSDSGAPLGTGRVVVESLNSGDVRPWGIEAKVAAKADACLPKVYAGARK